MIVKRNKAKNLAESMEMFAYDPSDNAIFESCYKRYETIYTAEVIGWIGKVCLLMKKFTRADYDKFANSILSQVPTDLTLAEAVAALKKLFGYTETQFSRRFKCFDVRIGESETYGDYGAQINKMGEKFDITNCSADDLKVLLYITGLKDPKHSLVLKKLLNKVNEQQRKLEAVDAARAAIVKLKINDLVNEAQNIITLKKDKSEICESSTSFAEVNAIKKNKNSSSRASPVSSGSSKKVSRPCKFCGGDHWDRDCDFKDKQCGSYQVRGHKT